MKVDLQKVSACRVKLIVSAEAVETRADYEAVVARYMNEAQIRGFRPGKAPRSVIEQRFRAEINGDARSRIVGNLYREAVKSQDLKLVNLVDVADDIFSPETGISFVLTVDVAPEFKLPKYAKLGVKPQDVAVSDEQVESRMAMYRKSLGSYADAEAGYALTLDDLVSMDYAGQCRGVDPTELGVHARLVEGVGFWTQLAQDELVPGLNAEIAGMKVDETRTFKISFPKDFHVEALAGKKLEYTVTVKAIRRNVPADDAAVLARFGETSIESLRVRTREALEARAKDEEENRRRREIFDALLKKADFDIPESELSEDIQRELQEMTRMYQGVPREEMEKNREAILAGAKKAAEDRLRLRYILLGIAESEKVSVSNDELAGEIRQIAEGAKLSVQETIKRLDSNGRMANVRNDVLVGKAVKLLMDSVSDAA